jgi:hypothetical protein
MIRPRCRPILDGSWQGVPTTRSTPRLRRSTLYLIDPSLANRVAIHFSPLWDCPNQFIWKMSVMLSRVTRLLPLFLWLSVTFVALMFIPQERAVGEEQAYPVPWKIIQQTDPPQSEGLSLYWFPSSQAELQTSSLRFSRILMTFSEQCVGMGIVDFHTSLGKRFIGDEKPPVAVLVAPGGTAIGRAENENGVLGVEQVEKLVEAEMTARENAAQRRMQAAEEKLKSGETEGAIQLYREIVEQKCLFPNKAKDAFRELKKLGVQER